MLIQTIYVSAKATQLKSSTLSTIKFINCRQFIVTQIEDMSQRISNRTKKINQIKSQLASIPLLSKNITMAKQKLQSKQFNASSRISKTSHSKTTIANQLVHDPHHDVNIFQSKYVMGNKIGEGANGLVRICIHTKKNKLYAVKTMMIDEEHVPSMKKNFHEVQKLKHPSILKLKSLYLDLKKHISYLVMEYIDLPNLQSYAKKAPKPIPQKEIKWVFHELFKALAYLHSKNICHRDIKPENILVDWQNQKIKIIDFGITKNMEIRKHKVPMLTITGTLFYRAPEMFYGGGYNEKVDIWAAGISLYELLTGKTPFQTQFHSDTINKICNEPLSLQQDLFSSYSKLLKNFLFSLLQKKPSMRLSATEAKNDLWFDDCNKAYLVKTETKRSKSFNRKDHMMTQYQKFVPRLKEVNEGLLYMKEGVDKVNGADFHRIQTNDF